MRSAIALHLRPSFHAPQLEVPITSLMRPPARLHARQIIVALIILRASLSARLSSWYLSRGFGGIYTSSLQFVSVVLSALIPACSFAVFKVKQRPETA